MAVAGVGDVPDMIGDREDGSSIKQRSFEILSLEPGALKSVQVKISTANASINYVENFIKQRHSH